MNIHIDPLLPSLTLLAWAIVLVGAILYRLRQPYVVGYVLLGAIIGPQGFGLIAGEELLVHLGSVGVVLLLFFVGMEIRVERLLEIWKVVVAGTLLQIILSVATTTALGWFFDWPFPRSLLLGFVISLSSTAVVLKLLQDRAEIDTGPGRTVVGVLLTQDIAIVPMMIILGLLGGEHQSPATTILQVLGGTGVVAIIGWIAIKKHIHLPFRKMLATDREMEVFAAAAICLGLALSTAFLGLSTALGAFVGGLLVGAAKEVHWVDTNLHPFRVVFVALFFVSVGMLVDFTFLTINWEMILALVFATLILNTVLNSVIFKALGMSWLVSAYAAAHLAQIGEFSFVLAAIGLSSGVIGAFTHQMTLQVIAITLTISPFWIMPFRWLKSKEPRGRA